MLLGTGIDMVRIARVERALARFGDRFLHRVYTPGERAYCLARPHPAEALAARFAAKEACFKALGAGNAPRWREMEVLGRPGERPSMNIHGEIAKRYPLARLWVSLSHEDGLAVATVVAEQP